MANLRHLIVQIIFYMLLIIFCNKFDVSADESTKDRIEKHRAWLNQRTVDRQLVGYVETNDPLQKIKYFKKLIKFKNKNEQGNEISFVPHQAANDTNENELSTAIIDTGNKFAYDTVNHNNEAHKFDYETTLKNDILSSSAERNENIITENVDKHNSAHSQRAKEKKEDEHLKNDSNQIENEHVTDKQKRIDDDNDDDNNIIELSSIKPTTTTMDSEKSLNNTLNDFEIQRFISEHIKYKSSDVTIKKSWGKWSGWTNCSRTCGEGVSSQSRECMLKMYKNGKRINVTTIALNECIGFYKRFRICNKMECPQGKRNIHAEQCSFFNNQIFRGVKYEWEPYVKDDAECELNCKPINQKYFAKLGDFLIDGAPCTKIRHSHNVSLSDNTKAVCVEGKCKAVLKNGMISGSGFINSGNVRCGASVCRPISGIFLKNPLPNGYVHITTIPAAASNITITELRDSINLLALKSTENEFLINGNFSAAPIGITTFEGAGTEFKYQRIDSSQSESMDDEITEWITSSGPLFEPIHVLVLSQQSNPGVKYEYLLPINFANSDEGSDIESDYSEENLPISNKLKAANYQSNSSSSPSSSSTGRKKRKFNWKVTGFTECSKTCGGGIQQPIIRCVKGEGSKLFSPRKCAHLQKPVVTESLLKCNSHPCPAFWKLSEWSQCHCGETNEKINRTRDVKCVQELISGVVIQVNSGACNQDRPIHSLACECKPKVSKIEAHKHHNNHHSNNNINNNRAPSKLQQNTQSDQKINHNVISKHKIKPIKSKKIGVWLTSDWSESCSNECGVGQQFRTIFCDRTLPNGDRSHIERCDLRMTPSTYRECTSDIKCLGEWFIGPWSPCTGDCFNASRSRTVVCIKNDGFAEESECDLKNKPATFEDCTPDEMKDCRAKWHFSDWTDCSKPCGNGIQKRTVKCLEIDKVERILRESKNCKYSERPNAMKYCNTQDCSETTPAYDPHVDLIQSDDPNCIDEFPNCHVVLRSKLCGYHYYNENCCRSCRSTFSNELYH